MEGADEGFGVGHSRATQTRGIWVWGAPLYAGLPDTAQPSKASLRQKRLAMIFVDTEGFESTGEPGSSCGKQMPVIHFMILLSGPDLLLRGVDLSRAQARLALVVDEIRVTHSMKSP